MDAVGVRPGMVIGEVGAGRGYFTVKLARRVGPRGHVWANDIDRDVLDSLEKRCESEGLRNVTTVVGGETDPLLPSLALDMVFFVYSLHDVDDPLPLLVRLRPSLRPGATVVVLDQDPEVSGEDHFLPRDRVSELFTEAGYESVRVEDFLDRELLLVFRPK
jgi:ubiquinone/menaquinone biosynthesis C-methylase UbiE